MKSLVQLDINVTTHCNNRCVACSHASPFTKAYYMEPSRMAEDLAAVKPFMHYERIHVVGGEPLLHKNVVNMIRIAKESGVSDRVSLITNGKLLPKMTEEFWQTLDILQLSIYPNLDRSIITLCEERAKQHGFAFWPSTFNEFYLQFSNQPTDGVESFNKCHWKTCCYTLHEQHFYLCPQAAFFPKLFMGLEATIDGFPVSSMTDESLHAFMTRETPFNACKTCCGGHGKMTPWREPKTREEWLLASTLPT